MASICADFESEQMEAIDNFDYDNYHEGKKLSGTASHKVVALTCTAKDLTKRPDKILANYYVESWLRNTKITVDGQQFDSTWSSV